MIRAMVKTGMYTDPNAEKLLGDVLIQRRDKIAHAYLNAVNPVIDVALDGSGALTFGNAAVAVGVATPPTGGYVVHWSQFDNNTGTATRDRHVDSGRRTDARRRRRRCRPSRVPTSSSRSGPFSRSMPPGERR